MWNKLRDKLALYALRALYGKRVDFACCFFGRKNSVQSEVTESASVGVVFQGPIVDALKLREGLIQYRELLPESAIVLSTWNGSVDADLQAFLRSLRISCVQSAPPALGGIMNVNRQIVSTGNGINNLIEGGRPELIVKARTDYFAWRPDKAINHVLSHERLFGGADRIWGIDFNTRLDLPFSFADIFQVGRTSAMLDYWRVDELYPNEISVQEFFKQTDNQNDVAEILRLQPAEIFLARRYLSGKRCGYDYSSGVDYRAALSRWFGILDSQHIELAFGKYALAVPGYEFPELRRKKYVKNQDWLAMIAELA